MADLSQLSIVIVNWNVRDLLAACLASLPREAETIVVDNASSDGSAATLTQLRFVAEYLQSTVVDRVVAAVGVPDARLRVTLISSYLVGIATTRYLLRIEPLASATDDEVVALVGPTIQALLDPTRKSGIA